MAFSSGGSVEIQVKATIGGYQSSLDKMKKAFESINPGDAFGQSIKKAIQTAQTAITGLKESYQVKSSSGVDQVFNHIEDVAKSILHVNDLLQQTSAPNINLSALGEEVQQLVLQATNLKNSLDVSMSDGIRDAVGASSELSEVFKSLGVNVTTMTEQQGFKALEKGMKDAAKAAGEAQTAYDKVNNSVNELTTKQQKLQENPLSSKEGFLSVSQQLGGINTKGFDVSAIIETFRNAEQEIMNGMHRATAGHHKADFTTFMQEQLQELETTITQSNAPEKIRELIGRIQQELATGKDQKYTFTNRPQLDQLLNVDQMLASATNATPESLKGAMDQLTQVIDPIIDNFSSTIRGKFLKLQTDAQTGNLTENGITSFLDTFIAALPTKAAELQTALEEVNNTLAKQTQELQAKLEALNQATARVNQLEGVQKNYQDIIDGLEQKLAKLKEQADQLKQQIEAAVNARVGDVKRQGAEGAGGAGAAYREATSQVNMYKTAVDRARASEQMVGRIQGFVQRWFSIYSVVRMINKAIHNVIATVKELDKTITNIAIVTNMSQSDLWAQMGTYTETARKFATSISGVYEVAQLYYQQGLQSAQVTEMTEATLKLARIAGMGYADATNYMTNAVRSFKMEMSDAQRVTDVYSAISASAATSSSELAEAMSKTASSAEAVGSSFENTTAMMAVMIEATREAPQNIGSAMKSIISRYGEMTKDPTATKDSEGEEMSLNRVDKALKTVGITLQTAEGQFRNFDEVIMELAEKWDTIDKNTQRYIATIMAGNRQQSRFLALVSSYDRLKELSEEAANAEDASQLQFLKTLDSVDAKTTQLQTTFKSLYTDSGFEQLYKDLLDFANVYLKTFTNMAKWGRLPIPALLSFGVQFLSLARVVGVGFGLIKQHYSNMQTAMTAKGQEESNKRKQTRTDESTHSQAQDVQDVNNHGTKENTETQQTMAAAQQRGRIRSTYAKGGSAWVKGSRAGAITSMGLSMAGLGLSTWASSIDESKTEGGSAQRKTKAAINGLGKVAQFAGIGLSMGGGWGALIGGLAGAAFGVAEALGIIQESAEEKAKRLTETAEELNNTAIEDRNKYKDLKTSLKQVRELEQKRYDSQEDADAYQQAIEQLTQQFPQLSAGFDSAGNALANLTNAEEELAKLREKSAQSTYDAAKAQMEATRAQIKAVKFEGTAPASLVEFDDDWRANQRNNWWQQQATDWRTQWGSFDGQAAQDPSYVISRFLTGGSTSKYLPNVPSDGGRTYNQILPESKEILDDQLIQLNLQQIKTLYPDTETMPKELAEYVSVYGERQNNIYDTEWVKEYERVYSNAQEYLTKHGDKNGLGLWRANDNSYSDALTDFFNGLEENTISQTFFTENPVPEEATNTYWDSYFKVLANAQETMPETLTKAENNILSWGLAGLTDFVKQEEIMSNAVKILTDPNKRGSDEFYAALKQYGDALSSLQKMEDLPAFTQQFITDSAAWWEDAAKAFQQIEDFNKQYKAHTMEYLSGKQGDILLNNKDIDLTTGNYYEESAGSIAVVSKYLKETYYDQKEDALVAEQEFEEQIDNAVKDYNTWFSQLSLAERERLNEMLSDTSNYSVDDIIKEFDMSENIASIFTTYYNEGIESIQARLSTQIQKRGFSPANEKEGKFMEAAAKAKTVIEEQFFQSILSDYDTLIAGGYTEQGSDLLGAAADLFNSYKDRTADEQKAINKIIQAGDLSTISGIFDIQHNLTEAGLTDKAMNDAFDFLYSTVVVNLSSELDSFGYAISKKVEDFDKALSKANKGMGLDDAIQMAEQLNLTLNDFDFKEGKFFLKNFNKVREHYIEYFDQESEKLQKAYEDREKALDNFIPKDTGIILDGQSFGEWKQLSGSISSYEVQQRLQQQQQQQQWEDFWNGYITDTATIDQLFEQDFFKNALANPNLNLNATELKGVYSEYLKAVATGTKETFLEWYKKYNEEQYTALSEAQKKYFDWQIASSYIAEGNIQGFVESLYGTDDQINNKKYIQQIKNILAGKGSWTDLPKEIQAYASTWMKTFQDSGKKIFSTITSAFGSSAIIMPETDIDKSNWEQLIGEQGKSWAKRLENGAIEIVLKTSEQINAAISDLEKNPNLLERDEWLKSLNTAYEESAKRTSYGLAESAFKGDTINFEAMGKFLDVQNPGTSFNPMRIKLEARKYGYAWNNVTNRFEQDAELVNLAAENWRDLASKTKNTKERSFYLSLANTVETNALIKRRNAISDVVKNYTSATVDQVNAVIEQFGLTFDQQEAIFTRQKDNSYKVNVDELSKITNNFESQFGDIIEETLGTLLDTYASDLTAAASYVSKGTTKVSDMQKFSKRFKEWTGNNAQFKWDKDLGGFTVTAQTVLEYAQHYRAELIKQFGTSAIADIDQFVTQSMMKEFVDMSSIVNFASSGDKNTKVKIQKGLQAVQDSVNLFEGVTVDNILNILQAGGEGAVELAQILAQLTGEQLSDDDIENITMGYINRLTSVMDSIESLENGSFVGTNEQVKKLLTDAGFTIDDNGFVTSTGDVVKAYEIFYNEIKHSNNASLETINNAYLKILEYSESSQSMAIEALSNGASMTYEALNTMLTNMGMSLEVVTKNLEKYGLKSLGAGKVRIEDWATFSSFMGFDSHSEEYASAFNTYTQSMIELNRQTELNILDQFKNAMKSTKDDQLNVSYLVTRFGEQFVRENLISESDTLNGGILSFADDANRMQFSKNLISFAEQSGQFTDSEIAELKDEFEEAFITSLTDGITKALEGTLKRKDMVNLINVANMHGIELNEADFVRTQKGLKLSVDAAIHLYRRLGAVDALAEGITLENLIKSLSEANEQYLTLTGTLGRIKTLNKLIRDAESKSDYTRKQQYEAELEVAKEIAKVRATTKDDSLDFMNQKMPDVLSNPQNIAKSLVGALSTWNNAWQTSTKYFDFGTGKWAQGKGMMGMDAFYNLANMMNQMAGAAGKELVMAGVKIDGSATAMGELVSKAFDTMSVLEDGSTVVDLGSIGLDFKTGTEQMAANFQEGFQQLAGEQVDMLDQMIALVETMVALEQLGDVIGEDHIFTMGDIIFKGGKYSFTDEWNKFKDNITKKINDPNDKENYNKELDEGLSRVFIGDKSMKEIINLSSEKWEALGEKEQNAYLNAMQGFYNAVKNGDYSQENIWASVKEQLAATGYDGEIELADRNGKKIKVAFKNGFSLEADQKTGKYDVGGQKYDAKDAFNALVLTQLEGGVKNLSAADENGNITAINVVGKRSVRVTVDNEGKIIYGTGKAASDNLQDYLKKLYEVSLHDNLTQEEWEIAVGYRIVPKINEENIQLNRQQRNNLAATTAEKLQKEWESATTEKEKLAFKVKYGIDLEGADKSQNMDDLLAQILKANGVEEKTITATVNFKPGNETNKDLYEFLTNGKTVSVTVNMDKVTGKYASLLLGSEPDPASLFPHKYSPINPNQPTLPSELTGNNGTNDNNNGGKGNGTQGPSIPINDITLKPENVWADIEDKVTQLTGTPADPYVPLLTLLIKVLKASHEGPPDDLSGITFDPDQPVESALSMLLALSSIAVTLQPGVTPENKIVFPGQIILDKTTWALIKTLGLVADRTTDINDDYVTLGNRKIEITDLVTALLSQIKLDQTGAEFTGTQVELKDGTTLSIISALAAINSIIIDPEQDESAFDDSYNIILPDGSTITINSTEAFLLWLEGIQPFSNDTFFDQYQIELPNKSKVTLQSATAFLTWLGSIKPDDGSVFDSEYNINLPNGSKITVADAIAYLQTLEDLNSNGTKGAKTKYTITMPDGTKVVVDSVTAFLQAIAGVDPKDLDKDKEFTLTLPNGNTISLTSMPGFLKTLTQVKTDELGVKTYTITLPTGSTITITDTDGKLQSLLLSPPDGAHQYSLTLNANDVVTINEVTAVVKKITLTTNNETEVDGSSINVTTTTTTTTSGSSTQEQPTNRLVAPSELPEEVVGQGDFNAYWNKLDNDTKSSLLNLPYLDLMPSDATDFTDESIENWINESLPKLLSDNGLDANSDIQQVAAALARRELQKFTDGSNNKLWTDSINAYLEGDFTKLLELAEEAGVNVEEGFSQGMQTKEGEVTTEASSIALELLKAIKEALSIESPSKATEEMGQYLDEGLANGINSNNNAPIFAAEQLAQQIIDIFKNTLQLDNNDLFSSLLKFNASASTSSTNTSTSTGKVPEIDTEVVKNGIEEINSDVLSGVNLVTSTGQNFNSTFQNLTDRFQYNAKMFNHMIQLANDALSSTRMPDGLRQAKAEMLSLFGIELDSKEAKYALENTSKGMEELAGTPVAAIYDGLTQVTGSITTLADAAFAPVAGGLNRIKTALAGWSFPSVPAGATNAKGTIGPAQATGTLMGELGPELYVSGGRYHIAGQNGAEFVNLPDDAIVFNHLQTKRLLQTGAAGRGTAITNEHKAVAYAKGTGPAMASASAVLATLKQLRSMWQRLADMNLSELAGMGGGGGGGGGGQFTKDLERWFNLLQKIARLEQMITHEQQLQSKLESDRLIHGNQLYLSQQREAQSLQQMVDHNRELLSLQQGRYQERIDELQRNNEFFRMVYTFDENGALQLRNRENSRPGDNFQPITYNGREYADAYAFLAEVASMNPDTGEVKYNPKEQLAMLRQVFGDELVEQYSAYDSSGKKTSNDEERLQAFFDRVDGLKEEVTTLRDSVEETENNLLENQQNLSEILQKFVDNQLAVEQEVIGAIEAREQTAIDEAQKERDAFSKSQEALIDGLSKQLDKERKMYETQQANEDLNKMRRQLAILQRSGGSQSQIRSLQDQINSASQDAYFNAQQQQIDALKEASDQQIERMDTQIELMTETLEYQKENGLFWPEVTQIMQQSPEEIMNFIQTYKPDYRSDSELQIEEHLRQLRNIVEQWTTRRDDPNALDVNGNITETPNDIYSMYSNWYMNTAYRQFSTTLFSENYAERDQLNQDAINAFYETWNRTGDLRSAQDAAAAVFQSHEDRLSENDRNNHLWQVEDRTNPPGGGTGGNGGSEGTQSNTKKSILKVTIYVDGKLESSKTNAFEGPQCVIPSILAQPRDNYTVTYTPTQNFTIPVGETKEVAIYYTSITDASSSNQQVSDMLANDESIYTSKTNTASEITKNSANISSAQSRLANLLSLLNSSTVIDTPELNSLLSTWFNNTTPDSLTSLFNSTSALSTLRQLQQSAGQQTTNIVNINNPIVKDEDDIQLIKDTIDEYLGGIAKRSGAYMSVR